MTAQSAKDAYYVLIKFTDQFKVQDSLLEVVKLVHAVSLTESDLKAAASLKWLDMEDCLIAIAAQNAKADYIITRDKKGFSRSIIPAVTPSEWLEIKCNLLL